MKKEVCSLLSQPVKLFTEEEQDVIIVDDVENKKVSVNCCIGMCMKLINCP